MTALDPRRPPASTFELAASATFVPPRKSNGPRTLLGGFCSTGYARHEPGAEDGDAQGSDHGRWDVRTGRSVKGSEGVLEPWTDRWATGLMPMFKRGCALLEASPSFCVRRRRRADAAGAVNRISHRQVEHRAHAVAVGSFVNVRSIAQTCPLRCGTESSPWQAPWASCRTLRVPRQIIAWPAAWLIWAPAFLGIVRGLAAAARPMVRSQRMWSSQPDFLGKASLDEGRGQGWRTPSEVVAVRKALNAECTPFPGAAQAARGAGRVAWCALSDLGAQRVGRRSAGKRDANSSWGGMRGSTG